MKTKIFFTVAILTALVCTACNNVKKPDGMPELIPFKVKVVQEGKAVEGARVVLKAEDAPYVIDGTSDAQGIVSLRTEGKYPGVPAGTYKAVVTKNVETPSQFGDNAPVSEADQAKWEANRAKEYRPTHCYVNKKYGDFKTTDLSVTVSGPGEAPLEVGAAVDNIVIPPGSASKAK